MEYIGNFPKNETKWHATEFNDFPYNPSDRRDDDVDKGNFYVIEKFLNECTSNIEYYTRIIKFKILGITIKIEWRRRRITI